MKLFPQSKHFPISLTWIYLQGFKLLIRGSRYRPQFSYKVSYTDCLLQSCQSQEQYESTIKLNFIYKENKLRSYNFTTEQIHSRDDSCLLCPNPINWFQHPNETTQQHAPAEGIVYKATDFPQSWWRKASTEIIWSVITNRT